MYIRLKLERKDQSRISFDNIAVILFSRQHFSRSASMYIDENCPLITLTAPKPDLLKGFEQLAMQSRPDGPQQSPRILFGSNVLTIAQRRKEVDLENCC